MSNDYYTDADTDAGADGGRRPALDPTISFPAYAASTALDPQPVWLTLDAARERGYTGEIVIEGDRETRLYFDDGVVYFAERAGQPSLGRWLVEIGVLDVVQLERGVVRVGDVEHLGRLFDRDDTIDRDAVTVAVESATESVVSELANGTTASIRISAYRHHQSGVHRWFVGPLDTSSSRPISAVAQVDRSVVDELPTVGSPAVVEVHWDEAVLEEFPPLDALDDSAPRNAGIVTYRDDDPAHQDDPVTDEGAVVSIDYTEAASGIFGPLLDDAPLVEPFGDLADADDDFQIHWPDGTEEPAPIEDADTSQLPTVDAGLDADTSQLPDVDEAPDADTGAPPAADAAPMAFHVEHLPEPDAEVPTDVADAVRRALDAIESASTAPATLPEIAVSPIPLADADVDAPTTDEAADQTMPVESVSIDPYVAEPAPEVSPFAPPTLDQRAEVIYARAVEAAVAAEEAEAARRADAYTVVVQPTDERPTGAEVIDHIADLGDLDEAAAPLAETPPVAVSDDDADRKGALRRLIGSLRRKDA